MWRPFALVSQLTSRHHHHHHHQTVAADDYGVSSGPVTRKSYWPHPHHFVMQAACKVCPSFWGEGAVCSTSAQSYLVDQLVPGLGEAEVPLLMFCTYRIKWKIQRRRHTKKPHENEHKIQNHKARFCVTCSAPPKSN